jgi:hypothetical protein
VHSLDWRWGPGEYLDRDRVDAIVDHAVDMEPWAAAEGPVGPVHPSYLIWYHNGAMSNGAAWPLQDCTAEQITAFTTAAIYFGLEEIAYLIDRPESDDALDHEYDRSFVKDLASDPDDAMLVRSAIDLAHNLGLFVTAEGVEDFAALTTLRDLGCDFAQGFALARPVPADDLAAACDEAERTARAVLATAGGSGRSTDVDPVAGAR